MTVSECQVETLKHIEKVRELVRVFVSKLVTRAQEHDKLKLESPEVEIFAEYTPKLADTTYGSEEYMNYLKEMDVALQHHYANYRHHPEHFDAFQSRTLSAHDYCASYRSGDRRADGRSGNRRVDDGNRDDCIQL